MSGIAEGDGEMAEAIRRNGDKAERILAVTRDLLLKRGVRGMTVAELAERAHVGKGTVYLYWDTKEELFFSVLARDFLDIQKGTAPR